MTAIRELHAYAEPGVYAMLADGTPRVMVIPYGRETYLVALDSYRGEGAFTIHRMDSTTIGNGLWLGDLEFKIAYRDRVRNGLGAMIAHKKRVGIKCRFARGGTKMLWFPENPIAQLRGHANQEIAMPWKLTRANADGTSSTLFEPDLEPLPAPQFQPGNSSVH